MRAINAFRSARWLAALATIVASASPVQLAEASEVSDPWGSLDKLRDQLGAETIQADFVQTFSPAGFSSGDRESGRLYLALPDCLRWDYDEPNAKTFLLCKQTIHAWNPGDQAGRRFMLTAGDEPGIDLLRLRLEELRLRYDARAETRQDESLVVILTPLEETHAIAEATLILDAARRRLAGFSFRDREGNLSRFDITNYEPHSTDGVFELPVDLEWLDQ